MAWTIEFAPEAVRELNKLDRQVSRRILKFLRDRVANLDNPRSVGSALQGAKLGEFWKYRVGDYRIICRIDDETVLVLVLRVGHRKEVYR
jgi:mRNA interferase RelE/StbE